jgi:transposase
LRPVLAPLVAALAALEEQIRASSRDLEARALADPIAARLMSVPGVGPVTALTFKSCIEDPGRFARSADAGAYAGLVPRRFQSGERDTKGHITKAGDPMLRRALYEVANNLLARVKRPSAPQRRGKAPAQAKGRARPRRRRPQARHSAAPSLAVRHQLPMDVEPPMG